MSHAPYTYAYPNWYVGLQCKSAARLGEVFFGCVFDCFLFDTLFWAFNSSAPPRPGVKI